MDSPATSTKMSPWLANLIRTTARAITTWISIAWTWGSLRKTWQKTSEQARQIGQDAVHAFSHHPEPETWQERLRGRVMDSRPVQALRERDLLPEGTMEKKRSWSFFKVILVLGIVIAVAVFILDRVLPKPYRDEELDEAWDEEDEFVGTAGMTPPPAEETAGDDGKSAESDNGSVSSRKRAKKTAGEDKETEE
ncbi:MAG: hypothetical protein V2A56_09705 [bacterium]